MPLIPDSVAPLWRILGKILTLGRDNSPIATVADLERFVATRAAYVGQTKLYGYLKTRIGTRYPRVFDDDIFVRSMNIAKYHVFAACLSDLAIFAVATALLEQNLPDERRAALAMRCFRQGLDDNSRDLPREFSVEQAVEVFARRLASTDWFLSAPDRSNFTESPKALLKWAPIAERLKREDAEIVKNSIKFAWRDIREQYCKRLDADGLAADFERLSGQAALDFGHGKV